MIQLHRVEVIKKDKRIVTVHDLNIESGEVTAIIGPNGAGKTSLLKVMALLDTPNSGIIRLNGKQVYPGKVRIEERRKVAVVFQQPLMLDTTVYQNVAVGLKFRGLSKKMVKEKVFFWLRQFGIEHLATERAVSLSGGEAQRVSIARAMAVEPEVLFLDEPFSALDLPTRRKLLTDFNRTLRETKTTTIFISHDYSEVQYLCDEIILMYEGEMIDKVTINMLVDAQLPEGLVNFLKDWMTPLIGN